jgi:hypothetical protein
MKGSRVVLDLSKESRHVASPPNVPTLDVGSTRLPRDSVPVMWKRLFGDGRPGWFGARA